MSLTFRFSKPLLAVALLALASSAEAANSISMEFVKVPAGSFLMGCNEGEECASDEKPSHLVTINADFWIGKTEVTQAQWKSVMGGNPSRFKGDDRPVEQVDWASAKAFAQALSDDEGCGNCYRLPTEAEWECAARMDGATLRNAVFGGHQNGIEGTEPVCSRKVGKLGLCDVLGNVWEWTLDWYGEYSAEPQVNPNRGGSGQLRVFRGGGWPDPAKFVSPGGRLGSAPGGRIDHGFRLLRTTP